MIHVTCIKKIDLPWNNPIKELQSPKLCIIDLSQTSDDESSSTELASVRDLKKKLN